MSVFPSTKSGGTDVQKPGQSVRRTNGRQRNDVFVVHRCSSDIPLDDEAWSVQATVPSFDPNGEGKPPFLQRRDRRDPRPPDPFRRTVQAPVPSGLGHERPGRFNKEVFEFATTRRLWPTTWPMRGSSRAPGVFEIMAEVVRRLVVGETLETTLSANGTRWLRATEELFFRDAAAVLHLRDAQRGAAPGRVNA